MNVFDEVARSPRRAWAPHPELRVIERPGWLQIITPPLKDGGLNEVIHAELGDDEADAVIASTIALYRDQGIKFRWTVGPGSTPADLGDRLARAGLVATPSRGMAKHLEPVVAPANVTLVDASTIESFSHVMAEGWGMDAAPIAALNRLVLASPQHRLFLATVDGVPAAMASYVAFSRSAYLIGAVVLPASRGRGLYRALVEARCADAYERGIRLATSYAREATSAPILEHFGFETLYRFDMYFG